MSIYNEKHRDNDLKLHIFTPKRKKTELKNLSRTGYSISVYAVCGRTKTTDVYIDRMLLCGCRSLIQKMIYLLKKNEQNQTILIDNREHENINYQNNDENERKLEIGLSLVDKPLINDNTESVYLGG